MAEQNRRLASCIGIQQSTELASSLSAEHQKSREPSPEAHIESRFLVDSIPYIDRPVRRERDFPRSMYTGDRLDGVNYSEISVFQDIFDKGFMPTIFEERFALP